MINPKEEYESEEQRIVDLIHKVFIVGGLVILGLIVVFNLFYMVNAGERAILVTWGNPDMTPKSEGLYLKIPIAQNAIIMDVKTQKYQADLTAASKDLQDVKTSIAINYHIVPESASVIYKEIGLNYADKVIYPLEQETNKGITAQYTAEELITKREEVRDKMKISLKDKLAPRGITVEEISIVNFEFSPSFTAAIEAKVTAEQNALAAKNKLEQIKYEAQQTVAAAEGQATAIRIKGQALKENPQLVQLEAVNKWNGVMPLITGSGATPFIDIQSIINKS